MTRTNVLVAATLAAAALFTVDIVAAAAPAGLLDPVTVTAAKTKADHQALAAAYEAEAAAAEQKAQMHVEMAAKYRDFGTKPPWSAMASHCTQLKKQYVETAKLNRELAAEHRKLAATLP
jgi:hypothetical protein